MKPLQRFDYIPVYHSIMRLKWWKVPFKKSDEKTYSNVYRLVNSLLEAGFNVGRFTRLRGARGTGLNAGDFIIGVDDLYSDLLMEDLGDEYGIVPKTLKNVDPQNISQIRQPLIGVYSGRGTSASCTEETVEALENMGFRKIVLLTGPLTPSDLSTLDTLIFGGGDSLEMLRSLEREETRLIRQFVESGGVYIGICAGAILPIKPVNVLEAAYGELEAWSELQLVECELLSDRVSEPSWPVFSGRRVGEVLRTYPVKGSVKSKIVRRGLLTLGYRGEVSMFHTGPLVKAVDPKHTIGKMTSPSSNVEYGLPCEMVHDIIQGASSIVLMEHGSGKLVLFFSHVESRKNQYVQGLLGNALLLRTYGNERKGMVYQAEVEEAEGVREAAESWRIFKLIKDSMNKAMDQVEGVIPGLYSNNFSEEVIQLSSIRQAVVRMMSRRDFILESMDEFIRAEKVLRELRKKLTLPQIANLSNSLNEWRYVIGKARRAFPQILEEIMKVQELMVDLSTAIVSSKEDVERRYGIFLNMMVGGKENPKMGIPASSGIIPPLLSIIINIEDSLEKMKFLRKTVAYAKWT